MYVSIFSFVYFLNRKDPATLADRGRWRVWNPHTQDYFHRLTVPRASSRFPSRLLAPLPLGLCIGCLFILGRSAWPAPRLSGLEEAESTPERGQCSGRVQTRLPIRLFHQGGTRPCALSPWGPPLSGRRSHLVSARGAGGGVSPADLLSRQVAGGWWLCLGGCFCVEVEFPTCPSVVLCCVPGGRFSRMLCIFTSQQRGSFNSERNRRTKGFWRWLGHRPCGRAGRRLQRGPATVSPAPPFHAPPARPLPAAPSSAAALASALPPCIPPREKHSNKTAKTESRPATAQSRGEEWLLTGTRFLLRGMKMLQD